MMKKVVLKDIVKELIKIAPDFRSYKDFKDPDLDEDNTITCSLFPIFARYFTERLEKYPEGDPIIQKTYQFFNEGFNGVVYNEHIFFWLGKILEILANSKKATEVSKKFLIGKALHSFNARIILQDSPHELIKIASDFKEYKDFKIPDKDDELMFEFHETFARYFTERLEKYPEGDPIIQKTYQFFNKFFLEIGDDKDRWGMSIAIFSFGFDTIFAILTSSKKATEVSKKFLIGKALDFFNTKVMIRNIMYDLIRIAPDFKEYDDFEDPDKDGYIFYPTVFVCVFARYFTERLEKYPEGDPIIQKTYQFFNEHFNRRIYNKEIIETLREFFEVLAGSKKATEVSRKYLTGKALESFNASEEYYGVSE